MYSKIESLKLFDGYLLSKDFPLKINLPIKLVICLLEAWNPDLIDLDWYETEEYKDHPYSLFNLEDRKAKYLEDYNQWRKSFNYGEITPSEIHDMPSNFKDLLNLAHKNNSPIVIGESHDHSAPKAILMHNIEFLKEKKAVFFLEGFFQELQEELNKSVEQKHPTPLIEAFLQNAEMHEPARYYSKKNLVRICIQEGIPLIACDNNLSTICGEGLRIEEGNQIGKIERMTFNYETHRAINYAKEKFPNHSFHIFLVGDAHVYNFQSIDNVQDGIHPGIVEITKGIYINAANTHNHLKRSEMKQFLITKEEYFALINQHLGKLTDLGMKKITHIFFSDSNVVSFEEIKYFLRNVNEGYFIKNSPTTIPKLYTNYLKYLKALPAIENSSVIDGYRATARSGYQLISNDEKEIEENEGPLLIKLNYTPLSKAILISELKINYIDQDSLTQTSQLGDSSIEPSQSAQFDLKEKYIEEGMIAPNYAKMQFFPPLKEKKTGCNLDNPTVGLF